MPTALAAPLRPLAAADPIAVERLLDAAFGPDRRGRTAYRLREGLTPDPDLSFAVFVAGRLGAVLMSWPVRLVSPDGATALALVGPVAVDPALQNSGLGTRLMRGMLAVAETAPPLVLIGDAAYYGRFGFVAGPTQGWELPGPFERHRLLVRADRSLPATGMLQPDVGRAGVESAAGLF